MRTYTSFLIKVLFFCVILMYFLVSQLVPWPTYNLSGLLPIELLFDLLFSTSIIILISDNRFSSISFIKVLTPLSCSFIFAVATLIILYFKGVVTPFKYIQNVEFKLVILAPVIEELLFRGAFHSLLRILAPKRLVFIFSGILFSLGHVFALVNIAEQFQPFIITQISYTLLLGMLMGYFYEKFNNLIVPISMHFIFNLCFLIAFKVGII